LHSVYRFLKILNKELISNAPTLRSIPCRVVGMPVLRANFCFAEEIPIARFHEKENPYVFLRAIINND
jgi:hypothetical protein